MTSASRTELLLVSIAGGAVGGGLVALGFTVGGLSLCASRERAIKSCIEKSRLGVCRWLKLCFQGRSSLPSEGENDGENHATLSVPSQSREGCSQRKDCSLLEPKSSRHSFERSFQSTEVDGFEDVGTLLKVGDMNLDFDHPASTTSQALTFGDKPDPYNPSKRTGYLSWDDYFMAIAFLSARRSKDPNRQVGACIVSQDRVILGIGYNGFPRGCSDDELPWAKKSASGDPLQTKYPYVCHAEVNAILNKNQASASGQRLYVTLFPCNECAKIIIQAGIAEVVYFTNKGAHVQNSTGDTEPAYVASWRLLTLAGVKVWQHQPTDKALVLEFR